ncbi:hypothetical protein PRIPAC_89089 [Pristionchus pacificus]|nr:hypothetical protein PRIPAC_89089 [Pristionchus pacificus]
MFSPKSVSAALATHFGNALVSPAPSPLTDEERRMFSRLKILLTEKEQGLIESEEEDEEALVQESGDSDSDYDAEEDEKPEQRSRKPWTKELCDKMLEFYRSKDLEDGRRGASQSFKRMQNRFRAHMKTEYDLTLLRKYEKTGVIPSERYSAMRQLASDVRAKLGEKMKKGVPIHDTDIRKIALDLNKLNAASGNFKIDELRIKFLAVVRKNPGIVIINADQTGQVKEMHSTRTLAEEGSKDVVVEIESKSSLGHRTPHYLLGRAAAPYRIRPLGRANWILTSEESSGLVPKGHKVTILNIPKGGTSLAQPLDLCYNQQWKCVMRRLNDAILVHDIDFVLHTRDNLLRCISQVYWAFGAPMLKEYRKYGWYRGGFLTTHPAPFVTPPKRKLTAPMVHFDAEWVWFDNFTESSYHSLVSCREVMRNHLGELRCLPSIMQDSSNCGLRNMDGLLNIAHTRFGIGLQFPENTTPNTRRRASRMGLMFQIVIPSLESGEPIEAAYGGIPSPFDPGENNEAKRSGSLEQCS